jgi:natural product precursor
LFTHACARAQLLLYGFAMKKTKKLVLNVEKVRELVDSNLERVQGGYFQASGSQWCSSAGARKCTYGCGAGGEGTSALCRNK